MCCAHNLLSVLHANRTGLMTSAFQGENSLHEYSKHPTAQPQEVTQQQLLPWVTRRWTVTPPHLPLHLKSSVTFFLVFLCGGNAACRRHALIPSEGGPAKLWPLCTSPLTSTPPPCTLMPY